MWIKISKERLYQAISLVNNEYVGNLKAMSRFPDRRVAFFNQAQHAREVRDYLLKVYRQGVNRK